MSTKALVIVIPGRGPAARVARRLLELPAACVIEGHEDVASCVDRLPATRLVAVLAAACRPDPWLPVGRLLEVYYRGPIAVVGRSNGFSGLQDEGVFDFGLHQAIGLWRLLTPRQYPVRNRTKAMANLRDTDVLEKIAAGDRHVIPSFWAVSAFVSGRNADAQAAWSEVHLAGEWISRFKAKADGAGMADLGLLVTRLRKMLETAADTVPQDRGAKNSLSVELGRVTAEWEIGWRRFASAMVISSAAEDPCPQS